MQFELYTDKTVAQCMSAVTERLAAKGTASRPEMDGWVEKGGRFSMAVTTQIAKRFPRKTRLTATVEREKGVTIIRGSVPDGVSREGQAIIFGAFLTIGLILLSGGDALLALLAIALGAALYIPLQGDAVNSAILLKEVRSILSAKEKPLTKKSASASKSAARTTRTRPQSSRPSRSKSSSSTRSKSR